MAAGFVLAVLLAHSFSLPESLRCLSTFVLSTICTRADELLSSPLFPPDPIGVLDLSLLLPLSLDDLSPTSPCTV